MTTFQLHQLYIAFKNAMIEAEQNFGNIIPVNTRGKSYALQFEDDIRSYCWYLSAADGILEVRETQFMNEVFGESIPQAVMIEMLKKCGIALPSVRQQYENGGVPTIGIAVCADYLYSNIGKSSNLKDLVIQFFTELGVALIGIDGEVTPEERDSVVKFVTSKSAIADALASSLRS